MLVPFTIRPEAISKTFRVNRVHKEAFMNRGVLFRVAIGIIAICILVLTAKPVPAAGPPSVASKDQAAIIKSIVDGLKKTYVFPEVADQMAQHLQERLAAGVYDNYGNLEAFCGVLTEDLQSISHDKHLRVGWQPPSDDGAERPSDEERRARFIIESRRNNFCFERVERLPGNIGYIKLNCFAEAEIAGATAVAAMTFLAHTEALIFDLRDNGGGHPSMIQLISSYLFEEPQHLNSFYIRRTDSMKQFWTQAHVEGTRLSTVPVYVVTSGSTFSGAEEFAYNLKSMKRATIVGQTTGGGAHPVDSLEIEGYDVVVSLPYGRAVNPITDTNWEGTGVQPDIETTVTRALDTAHLKAVETLQEAATSDQRRQQLAWFREGLEARLQPVSLEEGARRAYLGTYGPRKIFLEGGALHYQREGGRKYRIAPMSDDLFYLIDERRRIPPELDYFRLEFERDSGDEVVRIVGLYDNGQREPHDRTGP